LAWTAIITQRYWIPNIKCAYKSKSISTPTLHPWQTVPKYAIRCFGCRHQSVGTNHAHMYQTLTRDMAINERNIYSSSVIIAMVLYYSYPHVCYRFWYTEKVLVFNRCPNKHRLLRGPHSGLLADIMHNDRPHWPASDMSASSHLPPQASALVATAPTNTQEHPQMPYRKWMASTHKWRTLGARSTSLCANLIRRRHAATVIHSWTSRSSSYTAATHCCI
jgi:hypothetical protein